MKFGAFPNFLKWRASRATTLDWTFQRAYDWAKANKVPFGAYHFPYPVRSYPADIQAVTFSIACPDRSIPCALDWEQDGTVRTSLADVNAVANAIRKLGYRVPTLYTGSGYWTSVGSPNLVGYGFDLWRARYGDQKPTDQFQAVSRYAEMGGDKGSGWEPLGGLVPAMWQFSSRVWWGDRYMDHSAIRRPKTDLSKWFQTWTVPTPPPPKGNSDVYIDSALLASVKDAPPVAAVNDGTASTWLQVALLKIQLEDLQKDAGLPVTAVYDQATANVLDQRLGS